MLLSPKLQWSTGYKIFSRGTANALSWHVQISWWRHQMETFSALLALCAGNPPVTGEFPSQRPVTRSFDVFFDLCMKNGWVNNCEAGKLRRHRAHSDVTNVLQYERRQLLSYLSYDGNLKWNGPLIGNCEGTVKPVYNDHLMGYFSAFWSSSRWPRAT